MSFRRGGILNFYRGGIYQMLVICLRMLQNNIACFQRLLLSFEKFDVCSILECLPLKPN
jgi:hypothetical protein